MKNIEELLLRYRDGSLTPDELAELNQLTHRDRVMDAARKQARAIKVRRYTVVAGVAAVLAVAGTVFHTQSAFDGAADMPMVAQAEVPSPNKAAAPEVTSMPQTGETKAVTVKDVRSYDTAIISPKPRLVSADPVEQPANMETIVEQQEPSMLASDPVVACNTECSPDSVINDIWKFLRT